MARRVDAPKRSSWPVALAATAAVLVVGLVGAMFVFGGHQAESPGASSSALVGRVRCRQRKQPPHWLACSIRIADVFAGHIADADDRTLHLTRREPDGQDVRPTGDESTGGCGPNVGRRLRPRGTGRSRSGSRFAPTRPTTTATTGSSVAPVPPDPYNHAKPGAGGKLMRLHDGIDIYAPENEPVLAPFDGVVIDPATQVAAVGARSLRPDRGGGKRRADQSRIYSSAGSSRPRLGGHRAARQPRPGDRRARTDRQRRGRRAAAPLRAARTVR